MNTPSKPYRVSVAPSGPGQWALIVRSLRVPAAVVRLNYGSRGSFGSVGNQQELTCNASYLAITNSLG